MQVAINIFENGAELGIRVELNTLPDFCPICNHAAQLIFINGFASRSRSVIGARECMQTVVQCPRNDCKRYSIAYYSTLSSTMRNFKYEYSLPKFNQPRCFSDSISEMSPEFISIYNQALDAESKGLDKITGVGFRKALEFLIKDYLIKNNPEREEDIKIKSLGNCIQDDVKDKNIKSVSKRAVWLGNDETHYIRKWDGKDVNDLKMLIDLTLYWIDSEELTLKLEQDMPS